MSGRYWKADWAIAYLSPLCTLVPDCSCCSKGMRFLRATWSSAHTLEAYVAVQRLRFSQSAHCLDDSKGDQPPRNRSTVAAARDMMEQIFEKQRNQNQGVSPSSLE